MANRELAPPENGAFGESTREELVSFSQREAETAFVAPNAAKYLSELVPVAVNNLEEEHRTCGICQEVCNTGDQPEQACFVGPCGHILGRSCLSKWVMPEGRRPNNTCPLCRAVLFEVDTPDPTNAFDDVNREGPVFTIEQIRELARVKAIIEQLRDEHDERLLDRYTERLDLYNGLDVLEIEDETYSLAFKDAILASLQALRVWDRIRDHQRERAGVGIARPPYIFSEHVLNFFRRYVHRNNVGFRAAFSGGPSLRRLMGQLYDRLREDMERTAMPIVWTETGPPLSLLLDPATIPLIETALERLVDIERQWYESEIPRLPISQRFPDIERRWYETDRPRLPISQRFPNIERQ